MTRLVRSTGTTPDGPPPGLTYPEVGATSSAVLPEGYHHLRHREPIGHGRAAFEAAGTAVTTWRMHRASGARVHTDAVRAAPGVRLRVAVGVGRFVYAVPCEVVRTVSEERRVGFAYGTLAGHPECGEEAFVVELRSDGTVWFVVTAFSRPARWYTRLAGPLVPVAQRWYARRLGRTLRKVARG
ncbi:DUF1990 family protein [Streptomyces kanasensis]|uniref:DUF1990 family protein n=1 Tax=Streptomyces kanasensis TaxID=936756 RepID=UPI0036FAC483